MRIVVTGGDGFIASNLRVRLPEAGYADVRSVTRATTDDELRAILEQADFVFHLAGANRPAVETEFGEVNTGFTARLCELLADAGRPVPVAFASSTQAALDNAYGASKRGGEEAVQRYGAGTGAPVYLFRFPNVFGKWSRPDYNSAVATFCHNLARGLPISVRDASAPLSLLYVDDAVETLIALLGSARPPSGFVDAGPVHRTTVGEVVEIIESFVASRRTLTVPRVGTGLTRALYATYLSFLPPADFAYALRRHSDPRGTFVEMLKTTDSGQFSYFTAPPGVTRGEHYHHTKTEKFLIVRGRARFDFRHLVTSETFAVTVDEEGARVVDTVPGWAHSITNVGDCELVVMLWANEIFDPQHPDTIPWKVRT
jgi:UDP-2-acetamido-2,6-beta-L-arabino-hexul-4-ose reductase